jgi:hypothetical protein
MREATKTLIVVKTQFEGIHSWDKCPYNDVKFLCWPHRHIFHVIMKIKVSHDDRELEFIRVKRELEEYLKLFPLNLGSRSCEMIAKEIAMYFTPIFPVYMISVFEDEESGSEVYFE